MALEQIYHCDGPDCNTQTRDMAVGGWLVVVWLAPIESTQFHFCKPDCLLIGMAQLTSPTTSIEDV